MKTKLAGLISLFVLCAQVHVLADDGPATVSQQVIKAFQAAFPSAEKVDWSEDGDHYLFISKITRFYLRSSTIMKEILFPQKDIILMAPNCLFT